MLFLFLGLVVVCYNCVMILGFDSLIFTKSKRKRAKQRRNQKDLKLTSSFQYKPAKFLAYEMALTAMFLYPFDAVAVK